MTELMLDAALRQDAGKTTSRRLRRTGMVPGVIYGLHEPLWIQFTEHDAKMLMQHLHGQDRLVQVKVAGDGGKTDERSVIPKEVQMHPVKHRILHMDFQEINVNQPVQVSLEVHPEGEPAGVRAGGILQHVLYSVTIECLPRLIPEHFSVNVEHLDIGDSLHISDVTFPEGVTVVTDLEETLFSVVPPAVETEPEDEEAAEEGEEAAAGEGEEAGEDGESEQEDEG